VCVCACVRASGLTKHFPNDVPDGVNFIAPLVFLSSPTISSPSDVSSDLTSGLTGNETETVGLLQVEWMTLRLN